MSETKARPVAIGRMACVCCGEQITVKKAATGTLNVTCPDCDFSGYGQAGTDAHRRILARVTFKQLSEQPAITLPPVATRGPTQEIKPAAPHGGHRTASSKPAPAMPSAATIRKNTLFG
jgi:hypothetical protein